MRYRLWILAGLLHLGLVAAGAASFDFFEFKSLGSYLGFYGEASGSNTGYGFFAPGVFSQTQALYEVTDRHGHTTVANFLTGHNHEADLRIGDIIDQFSIYADSESLEREGDDSRDAKDFDAPEVLASAVGDRPKADAKDGEPDGNGESITTAHRFHRALAASLAGKVFAEHPEAVKVKIRLEQYVALSMQEAREGKVAQWEPLYTTTFEYRDRHSQVVSNERSPSDRYPKERRSDEGHSHE